MEVGSKNIAEHFAHTYHNLYNSVQNGSKLEKLKADINSGINEGSIAHVDKIDDKLIKKKLPAFMKPWI